MPKRRVRKTVKQTASSPVNKVGAPDLKEAPTGNREGFIIDQGGAAGFKEAPAGNREGFINEVERRIAAIRAIRDVEVEQLLTGLRLLRSYFNEEQLQTPVLQFFRDNLPNLSVVKKGKDRQYEVQCKDKDGNVSMSQVDEGNVHASLLHQMSIAYPDFCAATPSLGGFEFSSIAVKSSLFGAENMQINDFNSEESSNTQMPGLQDGLQTPVVNGQRLSVGMTPKTVRVPKHGEMLLSVHGSPLGVYKEDNMEAIHEESEEVEVAQ